MARALKPIRVVAPAEYKIPASFSREIGRIMVHWAYFENGIRRVLWELIGVEERMGRIAVRDPRIDDRLEMLIDVAFLKKVKIDEAKIKTLKTRANEILGLRDLLAHGIWVHDGNNWLVQMTSGNYPKGTLSEHKKRRIAPEGMNVDLDGLRTITDAIEILIEMIKDVAEAVAEQLQQSPEKRS